MTKKSMKSALTSSLRAEDEAVRNRFQQAESLLEEKTQQASSQPRNLQQPQKEDALQPEKKEKVIRDSFTLPSGDYELIATIRQRCLKSAVNATKSEVIRAGLHILQSLSDKELIRAIESLEKVKTGRPAGNI
ncbi:MAG: hypothetical protein ACYT04_19470 [Nostoc sp.]